LLNLRVFRCDWTPHIPAARPPRRPFGVFRDNRRLLARLFGAMRRPSAEARAGANAVVVRAMRLLRAADPDIFAWDMECRLLSGAFELERSAGERFRWVDREFAFVCRVTSPHRSIEVLIEPGPGVGFEPFHLEVYYGEHADPVHRQRISGMSWVEIPLPAARGQLASLRLRAEGGGASTGSDSRNLSFRVFAIGPGSAAGASVPEAPSWRCTSRTVATRPPDLDWSGRSEEDMKLISTMGRPVCLHLNACGDFTLMAREHWLALRGDAELDQFSMHLDSLLCYAAHHAGFREEILPDPMRIYHIEHGAGSGWTPEGQDEMYARIARKGIPTVSYSDLTQSITQMRMLHTPVIFNRDDWGLGRFDLPEITPPGAQA
jgi:hypothetical protein